MRIIIRKRGDSEEKSSLSTTEKTGFKLLYSFCEEYRFPKNQTTNYWRE
jgi:hypothetical protein